MDMETARKPEATDYYYKRGKLSRNTGLGEHLRFINEHTGRFGNGDGARDWLLFSASQDSGREGDNRLEEVKDGIDCNPEEAKGQRQEPDEGIQDERQEGQGPTNNQEDQPQEELDHQRTSQNSS